MVTMNDARQEPVKKAISCSIISSSCPLSTAKPLNVTNLIRVVVDFNRRACYLNKGAFLSNGLVCRWADGMRSDSTKLNNIQRPFFIPKKEPPGCVDLN